MINLATESDLAAVIARLDALEAQSGMSLDGPFVDAAENVTALPINGGGRVMLSVAVTVKPEDIVLVTGQVEVTNPYSFNVGFGRYIIRATSQTGTSGPQLVPPNMDNVTPNLHHKSEKILGVDTGADGTFWYNVIGYAAASGGSGNITVEQGYGRLSVLVFRR